MKLEAGWVPVALSSSIEPATSAGAVVEGSEIVVWRDNSGIVHVWEDRCPHRGMRMSFGFVRGDHIACLYHGWQYDAAGQCRYIPAHPTLDVPSTIKVPTYLAEERYGIIWATSSVDAILPEIADAADITPVRSLYVDCSVEEVLAALEGAGMDRLGPGAGLLPRDGDKLLIGIQAISSAKTAIHSVILGSAAVYTGARQAHHARLMENMRFDLERAAELA
jgi:nitrite reductase/ring-hydroxylating ferredoxin subunit